MSRATLYCGDAIEILKTLPDEAARCCVTSPPYWGLRDYGVAGQIGIERTPEEYVARMVAVFAEVRRVLMDDGTVWLNVGDSYAGSGKGPSNSITRDGSKIGTVIPRRGITPPTGTPTEWIPTPSGLKQKDLVGIPWRLAFALQADGWYLRSDIIWSKPNPMPESVTDRPTKAHEYLFLLSKCERYFYDADAIRRPLLPSSVERGEYPHRSFGKGQFNGSPTDERHQAGKTVALVSELQNPNGSNARTVWEIATQPYPEAHFATFPEELARRCILAGSAPGDTVLDPFGGSGTVAQVATGNGRASVYIDLNPEYVELAAQRIGPMLCERPASPAPDAATGEPSA